MVSVILGVRKAILRVVHAWIALKESISGLDTDLPEKIAAEEIFISYLHSKKEKTTIQNLTMGQWPNKYYRAASWRAKNN